MSKSASDPPQDPPSYYEANGQAPNYAANSGYSGNSTENGYPDEKKQSQYQQQDQQHPPGIQGQGPPPGTYVVPPQKANIAYSEDGKNMRPGYKEYLESDKERVARGDVPKPREAFGKHGAPLAPSRKGQSSGGFPGAHGPTYYNSSDK